MPDNVQINPMASYQDRLAERMVTNGLFNPNASRPWIGNDGQPYITVYNGGDPKSPASYQARPATYGTLRRDEWKQLDEAVLRIAEFRLGAIKDLLDMKLVYNLGNAMATTVLETHTMGNAMDAVASMDGITRSVQDRPTYKYRYMPIPIIHSDFEISARTLESSRRLGNPLDVDAVERGTRKVWEKLERMLISTDAAYADGDKGEDGRNAIYGYLNHPDRNKVAFESSLGWDSASKTAAGILKDVVAMKQASLNAFHYGPWMLYVPTAYETVLDKDYDTTTATGRTIRERIKQIAGVKDIKVMDTLTAGNVSLVEMNTDTVRLVNGMQIQVVQWKSEGNLLNSFKIMCIMVPQIRSDQDGHCGITHMAVSF